MKCESCEKLILLMLSQEANAWQRVRVAHHIRHCERCRQFQTDYLTVEQTCRGLVAQPSPRAIDAVLAYGRRELIRRQTIATSPEKFAGWKMFRPAWAYGLISIAALLAFIIIMEPVLQFRPADIAHHDRSASVTLAHTTQGAEGPDIDTYLEELAWMLDATYLDAVTSEDLSTLSWATTEQLAAQLLTWEDAEI